MQTSNPSILPNNIALPDSQNLAIWLRIAMLSSLPRTLLIKCLREAKNNLNDCWALLKDSRHPLLKSVHKKYRPQLSLVNEKTIAHALEWQNKNNCTILTWDHPSFPTNLWHINPPPLLLYVEGDLVCLHHPQIAIVGSRKATPWARQLATQLASELARQKRTITSGLALGIDTAAHLGALCAKNVACGKTIAVLGSGLENIYPKGGCALSHRIIEQGGAVISEYPLHSPPLRHHFPQRNRIISGLSLATLVVEAGAQSGSLITARLALEQGKELMVIPTTPGNPQTEGGLTLLKKGALLVTSTEEIIEATPPSSWPDWIEAIPSSPLHTANTELAPTASSVGTTNLTANPYTEKTAKKESKDHEHLTSPPTKKPLSTPVNDPSLQLLSCFEVGHCSCEQLLSRSGLTPRQFHVSLQTLLQTGYIRRTSMGYMKLKDYQPSIEATCLKQDDEGTLGSTTRLPTSCNTLKG